MISPSVSIATTLAAVSGFFGLASLLAAGFVLAWATLVWLTVQRLTRPPRRTAGYAITRGLAESPDKLISAPLSAPPRYTSWSVRTHDGLELPVWEIAGSRADGPTVIFSHGWGESRWMAWPRILALLDVSSRIICYDLRGHGESPGHSRCGLGIPEVRDLIALVEMVAGGSIVLHGFSLGAGVSIAAAGTPQLVGRIAMVIAEAPYRLPQTPAVAVLRSSDMPYRLNSIPAICVASVVVGSGGLAPISRMGGPFDRAQHAAKLPCRLVVIHGDADTICPPSDGKEIAAAALRGQFRPIAGAGHLDLWQPPYVAITAGLVIAAVSTVGRPGSGNAVN